MYIIAQGVRSVIPIIVRSLEFNYKEKEFMLINR